MADSRVIPQRLDDLQAALWPGGATAGTGGVWAVLDGARDARIHRALLASRLEFRCLYAGRVPRELDAAAPQLVELLPGHPLTAQLLGNALGTHWGCLLRIGDPSNLRHHLRKLLKVEGVLPRPVLFRFYDPRVLRAFLPQARPEQLRSLFGPVAAWVALDDAGALHEYRIDGLARLQPRTLVAAASVPQGA